MDKNQQSKWEALLSKHEIPLDYLQYVFTTCNLASISFGEPVMSEEVAWPNEVVSAEPTLLWSDEVAEIYYPNHPRVRHHLSDIKMYIQDGPAVGQTIPHVHMHILLTPSPLRYLLFYINYHREKTFTPEQMKPLVQSIANRLNDALMRSLEH